MKKLMRQIIIIIAFFSCFNMGAQELQVGYSLLVIKDPTTPQEALRKIPYKTLYRADYKVPDLARLGLNDANMSFNTYPQSDRAYAIKVYEDAQYKGNSEILQIPTGLLLNTKWAHSISSFQLLQRKGTDYVGGGGGSSFDDNPTSPQGRIITICIWSGNLIDAIRVDRVNELGKVVIGKKHGGNSGKLTTIILQADEFITKIGGRSGAYIDNLTFTTNKGKFYSVGGTGGSPFVEKDFYGPDALKGMSGNSGVYLDGISFWGYSNKF